MGHRAIDARTKSRPWRRASVKLALVGLAALLVSLAVPSLGQEASDPPLGASLAFGAGGVPHFDPYPLDESLPQDIRGGPHSAGEPTIGIPWNTDSVFFQAFGRTIKAEFDDAEVVAGKPAVAWSDVSAAFTPINVDPMIHADYVTGRIWAGGLAGPCSLMGISDDDGRTWTPAGNMCSGAQFDHQSIGSGPWSTTSPDSAVRNLVYPRATYYCAQLITTACATSFDGGRLWQPFTEVVGPCGGLHGHIAVSEATGFAAVPHGGCAGPEGTLPTDPGSYVGFAYTDNNGATWGARVMPEAIDGVGFDPDLAFSQESGWMWLAQADEQGIHIALSKDEGGSWETLGQSTPGAEPSNWLNLTGTFHDPYTGQPLVFGAFPDLEAGDDDRVALAFMATTDPEGEEPFTDCSETSDQNIWHYYLAQSLDAGATWTTTRLWEDPVQIGAIWNGGGGDPCRNLLDFNDMDMDSQGRLHVAFADGCTGECAEQYAEWRNGTADEPPVGEDSRDSWGVILRQTTGKGLFARYDIPDSFTPPTPTTTTDGDGNEMPGLSMGLLAAGLALAGLALRRRR